MNGSKREVDPFETYPSPPERVTPAKFVTKRWDPIRGLFLILMVCLEMRAAECGVSLRLLLKAPAQPKSVAHSLSSMSTKLQLQQEREREGLSALFFGGLWRPKQALTHRRRSVEKKATGQLPCGNTR